MHQPFDTDLIIIGAGIHGAAIAREACRNDYRVTILEQYDRPAQGTSSRSSKLIHGGLRYLESLELSLVYECLSDRKRLLRLYPDLVTLKKFYIPVYTNFTRSRFLIRMGLGLYAMLGGLTKATRFRILEKDEWGSLDNLKQDNLVEVFQYYDAQTDDYLLTSRLLDEAINDGLIPVYNATFESCEHSPSGVKVSYSHEHTTKTLTARYLVNAGGPWVNHVADKCRPGTVKLDIDLVQGTHIEIPGQLKNGIYYLEAPQDQRAVFAMPWKDHILFGTTETLYQGDPEQCAPNAKEINYLLEIYNHYFKQQKVLSKDNIINCWSGLRVLPKSDSNPFKRSRETLLIADDKKRPTIISVYGGKLTSHYSTAVKLLKMLKQS